MKRIVPLSLGTIAALTLLLSSHVGEAGKPCRRTSFETTLVKNACRAGGQKRAKAEMKVFVRTVKRKTGQRLACDSCHRKLGGNYPLEADGLKKFRIWGNRVGIK